MPNNLAAVREDAHRVRPSIRLNRMLKNQCVVLIVFGNEDDEVAIHVLCEPDDSTGNSKMLLTRWAFPKKQRQLPLR
jgi:hypothetical protein